MEDALHKLGRNIVLFAPFLFLLSVLSAAQQGPERSIDSQQPLQVDLLTPLDVAKLTPGAHIFAKARVPWKTASCQMRSGATVSGHVVNVEPHSKQSKESSVTVLFDTADCDGHPSHILFNLFAVIVDLQSPEGVGMTDYGTFGAASTKPHMGGTASSTAPVAMAYGQNEAIKSASQHLKLPSVIQSGQVFGQKNLILGTGTGTDGGSTLSSPKGNFRVEAGAQFVLMPKPVPAPEVGTAVASAKLPTKPDEPVKSTEVKDIPLPAPPAKPEIDETEVCSSPCNIVSSVDNTSASTEAASTLTTTRFGYTPHERGEYNALNHEATLTFLDAKNLLFTFDLHALRYRYTDGIRTVSMRTIRAVLIDPSTRKMKRILDWQVQGTGQYVWPILRDRILVHKGHTLYLMNSHLEPIRSVAVPGQLAFVSLSPDGNRIAVGTIHERHSRDVHDQLTEALNVEPEEDIDIQVFDDDFKLLLTSYQSTSLPPPVLSNTGEVRVVSTGHNRWRITEHSWDRTNRVIANVQSMCRPTLSTPLPESLFILGCTESPLQNWYRMLRSDGHPILLSRGSSREIDQAASSSNERQFTVRVVHTEHSKANGDFFHKSDLLTQEIAIYRASDGRRLFKTDADASLVDQSFTLSPSGDQLVVLAGGGLSFYTMPAFSLIPNALSEDVQTSRSPSTIAKSGSKLPR